MTKTITVRLDEDVYDMIKKAAEGQHRTISNYIEFATLHYTVHETLVDDSEMAEIMAFQKDIHRGLSDIAAGRYNVIG